MLLRTGCLPMLFSDRKTEKIDIYTDRRARMLPCRCAYDPYTSVMSVLCIAFSVYVSMLYSLFDSSIQLFVIAGEETMEDWDQNKLESVVEQRHAEGNKKANKTDIVSDN